ncbi:hypothetical protein Bca4012_064156 [Brassica carinata]|uniref:Uncharacterized protein n=1 Tax=Brassica carinata TaxID=52824 RepID=A0A8X7SER2_BRACI|nr:hypothetical protein Bca52824_033730 [Brassica carinata]KAG2305081.1 hypothetical protein Bca52824_033732 [Brassica carinata]
MWRPYRSQNDSLFKSNKELKVTMWHWKQQLFAEATSAGTSTVVVPLSTLKAFYGEATTTTQSAGETVEEESKMSPSRIIV